MDRLEFNKETPIPVIKGTNYTQEFVDRDAVRRRIEKAKAASYADNPYSAIYDWKDEEERALANKEKMQKTQQKIMRTNALGEAFRVLGEGISAGAGAPVTPRNPNPFILNAVSEYAKSDIDYINKLEGIRTKKLALKQADTQYNIGREAATTERENKLADDAAKELNTTIRELRLQENLYRLRGLENEANDIREKAKFAEEAAANIEIARKKAQFDRGIDLIPGQGYSTGIDILTPPAKGDKSSMQFVTPDTKQTIYLNPGLINYISQQLSVGKGQYDQTVPRVLRDIMANKNPQPEALAKAFTDNWDYIRDNLLLPVPDLAKQLGLEPNPNLGQQEANKVGTQADATQAPRQEKQEDGSVDLDENSKFALLGRIDEALNNTSISPLNKIGTIKGFIYNTYQAAGLPMSKFDAEKIAKEYVREWRQEQRTQ